MKTTRLKKTEEKTPRWKALSVSKRNRAVMERIKEYEMEWNTDFSTTVFRIVDNYYRTQKELKSHSWAVIRELAEPVVMPIS